MIEVGVNYSAVILDDKSKRRLCNYFSELIETIKNPITLADSIMICDGELPEHLKEFEGLNVCLTVDCYNYDDNFIIAGVSDNLYGVDKPFIIVARNKNFNNNVIGDDDILWKFINKPIRLTGKLKEVPFKIK